LVISNYQGGYGQQDESYQYPSLPLPTGRDPKEQAISSVFEIDNEPIVETVINYLRGRRLVDGDFEEIDPSAPGKYARINEIGIADISALLRTHVDKLMILSDLETEDIYRVCREVAQALVSLLAKNMSRYDIESVEHLEVIHSTIDHAVYVTLKRAFKGGERKHRETMLKLVEQYVQRETDKKTGFSLGGLFGGKKQDG
jgi:hypothetical protein